MSNRLLSVLVFLLLTSTAFASISSKARFQIRQLTLQGHNPRLSYSAARHYMFNNIHARQDKSGKVFIKDVYCHKVVYFRHNGLPKNNVMNCEHTWPRSRFSNSEPFSTQEADLHHLYPTDSRANSIRGNHIFTDFRYNTGIDNCAASSYGRDEASGRKAFEPPTAQKGNVARALFYFSIRYNIAIPNAEEVHLRRWNDLDPVDADEMRRNNLVQAAQGNRNPFIDNPALARQIADF